MTIKNLYPDSRPQSIYNVINGRPELPAASTFSRASQAGYFDADGLFKIAEPGVPRFNYDNTTGEFLGLLLEPTSRNESAPNADCPQFQNFGGDNTEYSTMLPSGVVGNARRLRIPNPSQPYATFRMNAIANYSGSAKWSASMWVKNTPGIVLPQQQAVTWMISGAGYTGKGYEVTDEWRRIELTQVPRAANNLLNVDIYQPVNWCDFLVWGFQLEAQPAATSYISVEQQGRDRAADVFSLTTSSDFDGGYSLLLDSDTTTEEYLYRIKASGTTISELKNDNGTLEWDINGTSAQSSGLYPQVGFVNGRVRTVSSFGAADGSVQNNYLYTTGLSFPTPAVVAPGADELEFGVPQTLKALYLWNGQLSDTEAVSVIKGEYNVVPNEPIFDDSYSFVYNTDPTDIGETSITLPYINPTVSERIYWGDGTNQRYEGGSSRPIPQHTYPYPGQYRIQITADDGFDRVTLGYDVDNVITRVDQWAPQHRVGASVGFTGTEMVRLLFNQATNVFIPLFKYDTSGITSLQQAFSGNRELSPTGLGAYAPWAWVPTQLPNCVSLASTFYYVGWSVATTDERQLFPTLQTSGKLTDVSSCFENTAMQKFAGDTPFSNTENVTNWRAAFRNCRLTNVNVNTIKATTLKQIFEANRFVTSPFFNAPNCTDFTKIFYKCDSMTAMNSGISNSTYRNGIIFDSAWQDCIKLTSFPLINTSSGTDFKKAWSGCEELTSFPAIDISNATSISEAWYACKALKTFPSLDYSSLKSASIAWAACNSLETFSPSKGSSSLDFPEATSLYYAWSCLLYTSPSPRDGLLSRMPSSA